MFELFNRRADYVVNHGNLPHWYQPGVTYFVTFRTADSVPQELLRAWYVRRDRWLRQHGLDPQAPDWQTQLQSQPELDEEYRTTFTREFMEYLDRSYGECVLRDRRLAEIVQSTLRHFDGDRYHLGDFIVMPNHVHLLVCLLGLTEIETQCRSWKKFSAGEINRILGRKGRFWQEESFDHLVRSPEQFDWLRRYIAENGLKAGLKPGDYLHYVRPV